MYQHQPKSVTRTLGPVKSAAAVLLSSCVALTACSSTSTNKSADTASLSPNSSSTSSPQPVGVQSHHKAPGAIDSPSALRRALVGRWEQTTTCQQRVTELKAVGFGYHNNTGANFLKVPGVNGPGVDHHSCRDPQPERDIRVFSAPTGAAIGDVPAGNTIGEFAAPIMYPMVAGTRSIADYRVVDEHTIVLFAAWLDLRHSVPRRQLGGPYGDDAMLRFHIRMPDSNTVILHPVLPPCASGGCYAAAWAVALSNNGIPWHRFS